MSIAKASQEQVAAMSAQQEKLEQQHCEDYSLWSEELLRGREKASDGSESSHLSFSRAGLPRNRHPAQGDEAAGEFLAAGA